MSGDVLVLHVPHAQMRFQQLAYCVSHHGRHLHMERRGEQPNTRKSCNKTRENQPEYKANIPTKATYYNAEVERLNKGKVSFLTDFVIHKKCFFSISVKNVGY